jgi:hypothetical protein
MDYMANRWYDPSVGEFVSVDPLAAVTNQAYEYANGDPTIYVDPLGLSWWNPTTWTKGDWIVVGGVVLGVAAVATGGLALAAGATAEGVLFGSTSVVAGLGAGYADSGPCSEGNDLACVGEGLGYGGAALSGVGVGADVVVLTEIVSEGSLGTAVAGGVGTFGWVVGGTGAAFDGGVALSSLLAGSTYAGVPC